MLIESVRDLVLRTEPDESVPGIVLAGVSLVVMPILARAKRKTGRAMGSATLVADAAETMLCALLSLILLIGLLLNASVGWWWTDSTRRGRDRGSRVSRGVGSVERGRGVRLGQPA